MCNFTPPSVISPETAAAFDDLRIAAAKYMGWDPSQTEMTICRPQPWCGVDADLSPDDEPDLQTVDAMTVDELDACERPGDFIYMPQDTAPGGF